MFKADVDEWFGDPRFEGSAHPDAAPVETAWCDECFGYTPVNPDAEGVCPVCAETR